MIRIILSSLIALHGVIHLTGFSKAWNSSRAESLAGKTIFHLSLYGAKVAGVLWLITGALLITSASAYYLRKEWFWVVGMAALAISQSLIILYWPEAKWGTVPNVILTFTIVFAAGRLAFDRMVKDEISYLISSTSTVTKTVTEEKISTLPKVIQTWLRNSRVVGKRVPSTVHILQNGSMRTDPNSEWMSFEAEEYFSIDPPGFVWTTTIHTDKIIDIVGRDKYESGKGNMLIKAASLIPVANSSGKEIDEGTLIRFMAEMIWFPQAAVSDYLAWQEIDSTHAKVTMTYKGVTASGICSFNDAGLPVGFEAPRYREVNGKFTRAPWSVVTTRYKYFDGVPVGTQSEVTWKLKDEDFTWLRLTVTEIKYE